jgi:hypothetical protein
VLTIKEILKRLEYQNFLKRWKEIIVPDEIAHIKEQKERQASLTVHNDLSN